MALALGLTACGADGEQRFRIDQVQVRLARQALDLDFRQALSFSEAAREALESGVPLTVRVDLDLLQAGTLVHVVTTSARFEIRYLPLSEHYRLTRPDGRSSTYPRLRHVQAELNRLRYELATGPVLAGDYELHARVRLDTQSLPAPMRLPATLTPAWRHDSEWTTWPFEITG